MAPAVVCILWGNAQLSLESPSRYMYSKDALYVSNSPAAELKKSVKVLFWGGGAYLVLNVMRVAK